MSDILRVTRSKDEARHAYDRMSRVYDVLTGGFENRARDVGLERLGVETGERVLEIGYATGRALVDLAAAAGPEGSVVGIDISEGMRRTSRMRLARAGLTGRVVLDVGDAAALPYADGEFDAAFMSFTLELFDTPEIPCVLAECRRVLRAGGRLGVVAMARVDDPNLSVRAYEWAHQHMQSFVDCRPIGTAAEMRSAGFDVDTEERIDVWSLPVDVVVGITG